MYECDAYLCRAAAVQIMGNEGGMSDESRFPEVWAGFSGTFREDIIEGFQPSSYYRDRLYTSYKRYQWEGPAGKAAILRALIPNDSTFQNKLRTAYVASYIRNFGSPRPLVLDAV
jgi:hypothetical protein